MSGLPVTSLVHEGLALAWDCGLGLSPGTVTWDCDLGLWPGALAWDSGLGLWPGTVAVTDLHRRGFSVAAVAVSDTDSSRCCHTHSHDSDFVEKTFSVVDCPKLIKQSRVRNSVGCMTKPKC